MYDLIIVGSGAAGLSAALYAGRYKMKVLVIGAEFGGEALKSGTVWNYPGVKGVDAYDLVKTMMEQAKDVGAEIIEGRVSDIKRGGGCFNVSVGDKKYDTKTVILAVGTERKKLGLPREKELLNKGIHYCVTCDGPVYVGKKIVIVGGGDAAAKGEILAAQYADKLYILVRGEKMKAEPIYLNEIMRRKDKIEVILGAEVKELIGDGKLDKIVISKEFNGSKELAVDGLFVEIGAMPNNNLAIPLGLKLDERGYVDVDNHMNTSVDGVFAAGDAISFFGGFKQYITAAASGAVAATSAFNYYKMHGESCELHQKVSL